MENVMKYEPILPEDFNGTFMFTNWTNEEFVGKWGNKEYHFAANSTSPMIIPEHSPLEIQSIRKKFAKDLAEIEFFRGKKYETLRSPEGKGGNRTMSGIHTASTYSLDELTEGIQRCLVPLETKRAYVKQSDRVKMEDKMSRDDSGKLNSDVIAQGTPLRDRALSS